MKDCVLKARNISCTYKNKIILKSIDLDIYAGEVTTLLGPNGAGKSTLVNMLTQTNKNHSDVVFFGKKSALHANYLAQHLAFLPQQNYIDFPFLAYEIVEMGAFPLEISSKETSKLAFHYMTELCIEHHAQSLFTTLSGGEQQLIHLARVLLQLHQSKRKSFLILDEPISALDLKFQHHVLKLLREKAYRSNIAVLQILHDLNLAAQYSDRMIFLNQGSIQVDGAPKEVLKPELIKSVYGIESIIQNHPIQDFVQMIPA